MSGNDIFVSTEILIRGFVVSNHSGEFVTLHVVFYVLFKLTSNQKVIQFNTLAEQENSISFYLL